LVAVVTFPLPSLTNSEVAVNALPMVTSSGPVEMPVAPDAGETSVGVVMSGRLTTGIAVQPVACPVHALSSTTVNAATAPRARRTENLIVASLPERATAR
jgi:hypothetical protein